MLKSRNSSHHLLLSDYAQQLYQRNIRQKVKQAQKFINLKLKHTQIENSRALLLTKTHLKKQIIDDPDEYIPYLKLLNQYNTIQQIQMLQQLKQKQNRVGFTNYIHIRPKNKSKTSTLNKNNNEQSNKFKQSNNQIISNTKFKRNLRKTSDRNQFIQQVRYLKQGLIKQRQRYFSHKIQTKNNNQNQIDQINQNKLQQESIKKNSSLQDKYHGSIIKQLDVFNLNKSFFELAKKRKNRGQSYDTIFGQTFTNILHSTITGLKSKNNFQKSNQKFVLVNTQMKYGKKLIKKFMTKEEKVFSLAARSCLKLLKNQKKQKKPKIMQIQSFKKLKLN